MGNRLRLFGLGFLGIELGEKQDVANAGVISGAASRVAVRVNHTDEEWMIAKTVWRFLGLTARKQIIRENEKD
jgi:acetate kinase